MPHGCENGARARAHVSPCETAEGTRENVGTLWMRDERDRCEPTFTDALMHSTSNSLSLSTTENIEFTTVRFRIVIS
jgi:hypothetical protein